MTTATLNPSSKTARPAVHWVILAMLGAVALAELPLLVKFFADLWTRPQYDFYPLILVGSVYLAWDRLCDEPIEHFRSAPQSGAILLGLALLALLVGNVLLLRYLGAVSAWVALAGCVIWLGGMPLFRRIRPSFILLLTIFPPPLRKDEAIALTLRQWAVTAADRLLDLMQIPHVTTGTLINIAGHRLGVEEACSGIHSLLAVVAVTLMLGFYWRREAWRILTLMGCSIVFVIWANVFRIALGAYLIINWKIDVLSGAAHEFLGLVLFMICIALTGSLDQFLRLIRPADAEGPASTANQATTPDAQVAPKVLKLAGGIGCLFLVMGIVTQIRVGHLWPSPRIGGDAKFVLPAELAGWQRVDGSEQVIGRPEVLGQYSFIWNYRKGNLTAQVGCDYPFPGYHELATCYLASGWKVPSAEKFGTPDLAGNQGQYTQLQLERPTPAFATLFYGCCDEQGRWLGPDKFDNLGNDALFALELSYQRARDPQAYQVQALLQGFDPASSSDQQALKELFIAARSAFAEQLVRQAQ